MNKKFSPNKNPLRVCAMSSQLQNATWVLLTKEDKFIHVKYIQKMPEPPLSRTIQVLLFPHVVKPVNLGNWRIIATFPHLNEPPCFYHNFFQLWAVMCKCKAKRAEMRRGWVSHSLQAAATAPKWCWEQPESWTSRGQTLNVSGEPASQFMDGTLDLLFHGMKSKAAGALSHTYVLSSRIGSPFKGSISSTIGY